MEIDGDPIAARDNVNRENVLCERIIILNEMEPVRSVCIVADSSSLL